MSDDFCMLPMPRTFPLGDPDSRVIRILPPSIKSGRPRDYSTTAHSRSVPLVLTCSDLDPRDLFVGCSKWRIITTYSRQAQLWIHVVRKARHLNNYRWGKCQFLPLNYAALLLKLPPFESQFRRTSQPYVTTTTTTIIIIIIIIYTVTKHSIGIHLRVTCPKFEITITAYVWMFCKKKENGQTDPDDTDCTISFRMTSVSCLERLVSRADIRQTFGNHRKLGQSLRQWSRN